MTARETLMPVLLEKVYKLIQDKLELAHQPLVTQLAQHLFNNISQDDLVERNESDLYGAVVSLWHHINEKKADDEMYPLDLNFCKQCFNSQLSVVVPPEIMFDTYLYLSSTSELFKNHFIKHRFM